MAAYSMWKQVLAAVYGTGMGMRSRRVQEGLRKGLLAEALAEAYDEARQGCPFQAPKTSIFSRKSSVKPDAHLSTIKGEAP